MQLGGHVREQRHRVRVAHVVVGADGRHAHADAVSAPDADQRVDHLEQEARAVLDRAAVRVGTLVAAVAQELIDL